MTPVAASRGPIAPTPGRAQRDTAAAPHEAKTASSRALIPLQPAAASHDGELRTRPQAGFLAHLIATDHKLPQTRERRRAEPADAIAAYAAAGSKRSRAGRRFFRAT
jgi:hypothetical protein